MNTTSTNKIVEIALKNKIIEDLEDRISILSQEIAYEKSKASYGVRIVISIIVATAMSIFFPKISWLAGSGLVFYWAWIIRDSNDLRDKESELSNSKQILSEQEELLYEIEQNQ